MPVRNNTRPSLPKSLLEELDGSSGSAHTNKRRAGSRQTPRKELRKQGRHDRKQRKVEFFSHHDKTNRPQAKRIAEEHPESPPRKKAKLPTSQTPAWVAQNASHIVPLKTLKRPKPKLISKEPGATPKSALEKLALRGQDPSQRRPYSVESPTTTHARSRQDIEEEKYISYLESKLGWTKAGKRTAKYGKEVGGDGLDDLLGDLNSFDRVSRLRSQAAAAVTDDEDYEDEEIDARISGEDEDNLSDENEEAAKDSDIDAEEWHGIEDLQNSSSARSHTPETSISGFPAAPASGLRYVPPHLRAAEKMPSAEEVEAQAKLKRQLNGLLNRMSEQNIASIIDSVEEVYRNHRRHDVTSTLTTLIIDGISAHSILLDSYVILHAAFVSSLHKLIGVEFAAYFMQNVIASYERHFASVQEQDAEHPTARSNGEVQAEGEPLGKECSNLIVLLSELYNFQVISCVLVYNLIRVLLDGGLTEFKVELLLKITRNSGAQLRLDDPSALKSIIDIVHTKIPSQANALSSRTRFMVETLTNLKNNKLKRNAGPTTGGDTVDRMKKFLAGLSKKRHVLAHEPLRVSLDDLHSAESKGKWWLVGAAWGGDPLVDAQTDRRGPAADADADALSENALLKLARKQGMNTDIRRGIFVVLMSSDDYADACERLAQLKLTETQQREIVRVILHCCGNEKAYNPYYTLVGQQLCRGSHAHKVTLQFCLWDFLRGLGETHVGGAEMLKGLDDDGGAEFGLKGVSSTRLRNVARAYAWWIAKDCCTLAVLKPVDFTVLQPQTHTFLKELFTQLFASTQLSTPLLSADPKDLPMSRNRGPLEEVFIKATRMHALVVGLVFFIGEAFIGETREDGGFVKWASQVARDTLRTGVDAMAEAHVFFRKATLE